MTFASIGFQAHHKRMKRELFLSEMEAVVLWRELHSLIEAHYTAGKRGRPPIGIERMLRIYFLLQWFNLSDPQAEDCLYDSEAMRKFVGIDLRVEACPDETTICKFHHLIEEKGIGKQIFASVSDHLKAQGIKIGNGKIVDATIITAPCSTKNKNKERDPEMPQMREGNQWYFGMKVHICVGSKQKIIHSVDVTPANVPDSQTVTDLLHGRETKVSGDSACQGQKNAIRKAAPKDRDMTNKRGARCNRLSALERSKNRTKSTVRSRAEHPFLIIKRIFGFFQIRYRGLSKNRTRFEVVCALTNLYIKRQTLMRRCLAWRPGRARKTKSGRFPPDYEA
jgi:IS5 family transposase